MPAAAHVANHAQNVDLAQLRRKIAIIAQRMRTPDPATTTVAAGEALALFAGELETVLAEENTFPMKRYP